MPQVNPTSSLEPNPFATGQLEIPVFNLASTEVLSILAMQNACMIVGEPHVGKTQLLRETREKYSRAFQNPTLMIDAKRRDHTAADVINFGEEHGGNGAIFIDNVGLYSVMGTDEAANENSLGMISVISSILDNPQSSPTLCVATLGLEPSVGESKVSPDDLIDLRQKFTSYQKYGFLGEITPEVARTLLATELKNKEAMELLSQIPQEYITYSAAMRILERRTRLPIDELDRDAAREENRKLWSAERVKALKHLQALGVTVR